MTKEEKQLLLKDLCARLPYGVKYQGEDSNVYTLDAANYFALQVEDMVFKPYLRPMSSMTEEEAVEMFYTVFQSHHASLIGVDIESDRFRFKTVDEDGRFSGHTIFFFDKIYSMEQLGWLNAHHFDYRGLIEKGLALEAPEGMYEG